MRRTATTVVMAAVSAAITLALVPGTASAAKTSGEQVRDAGAITQALARGSNFIADSFFSGTVQPGASKGWHWNNAGSNIAYRVGLSPAGASTSAACRFEVTNQWYERHNTGEREFHYTIKNTGTIACGTQILFSAVNASAIDSTGGLEPGETRTMYELYLDETRVPLLGLVPSGATSANSCRFKVTKAEFYRHHQGDVATPVSLRYQVQNIGNIACSADVEMGTSPVESRLNWRTLNPGASMTLTWNNANPTTATHLIGIEPDEVGCAMEITRYWYRQVINSNGTTERELQFVLRNSGTLACTARPTLSRI